MTTDDLTTERSTSSTDWAEAVHNFEQAKAAEAQMGAELDAATAALDKAVPDRADEFLAYGLHRYRDGNTERTKLIRSTEMSVAIVDYKGRSALSADDYAAIARKATTLVDDFLAWIECAREATSRIYGDAQERFDAACDRRVAAQDALLNDTPAPDAEALLFKLDLLAEIMTEGDDQDAPAVVSIRDDAKRLFGGS